jgi:nitric-oxide synthase, bacterial
VIRERACPVAHGTSALATQPLTAPSIRDQLVAGLDPPTDLDEAVDFLGQVRHHGRQDEDQWAARVDEVRAEIARTGTYRHTLQELTIGAKLAWYNHTRCIGKLHWRTLRLRDCRDLETADQIADSLLDHLKLSGNGGNIRPVLTVFRPAGPDGPGPYIHNSQLVRYAGHRMPDGTVLGDPANVETTDLAYSLGWKIREPGRFDILPMIVEVPGEPAVLREVPTDLAMEVPITHPTVAAFAELDLRWYGFPTVSDMELRIGGITYPAAPFAGWYVVTEIAARNFADSARYDLLRTVAEVLGLDTRSDRTLWKDRALVELTTAVLHSYDVAGIRMLDHHTATDQFHRFTQAEQRANRTVNAEWNWMVPPMSPSTTPVYHQHYPDTVELPNFLRGQR